MSELIFELLFAVYWSVKIDRVAPGDTNDTDPDVVPSSDDEALMPVSIPTGKPTMHELSAQTVQKAHAGQTYQVRLRRTQTDRCRKRARISVYTLCGYHEREQSQTRQRARRRLVRIHQAGISGDQMAACAHEIFVVAREGEPPLKRARRFVERLTSQAQVATRKPMPLALIKAAFEGWTPCKWNDTVKFDALSEEHGNQQMGKKLEDVGFLDIFTFGSWVCARCKRVNSPAKNPCPTLEMALCSDLRPNDFMVNKVFYRCNGDKIKKYGGEPVVPEGSRPRPRVKQGAWSATSSVRPARWGQFLMRSHEALFR